MYIDFLCSFKFPVYLIVGLRQLVLKLVLKFCDSKKSRIKRNQENINCPCTCKYAASHAGASMETQLVMICTAI